MTRFFIRFILSILIFAVLLFAQVWVRPWVTLFNILPLFILVWSFRYSLMPGGLLVLITSWFVSVCIPESFGITPFIAIIIWMIARSQRTWLEKNPYIWSMPVGFALTFIFLSLDRIAFSWMLERWVFNEELFVAILTTSAFQGLIAPLWVLMFGLLSSRLSYRRTERQNGKLVRKVAASPADLKRGSYAKA